MLELLEAWGYEDRQPAVPRLKLLRFIRDVGFVKGLMGVFAWLH